MIDTPVCRGWPDNSSTQPTDSIIQFMLHVTTIGPGHDLPHAISHCYLCSTDLQGVRDRLQTTGINKHPLS